MKPAALLKLTMSLFFGIGIVNCSHTSEAKKSHYCAPGQYWDRASEVCSETSLSLGVSGDMQNYTLPQLIKKYGAESLLVPLNKGYEGNGDPDKPRTYKGLSLKKIVSDLLPKGANYIEYAMWITCTDGYNPKLSGDILTKLNDPTTEGLLAFGQQSIRDAKYGLTPMKNWEVLNAPWGLVNPGPIYLVWNKSQGIYPDGFPFQMQSLELITMEEFERRKEVLKPQANLLGLKPKSTVEQGYGKISTCTLCHKVRGVGGSKSQIDLSEWIKSFRSFHMSESKPKSMSDQEFNSNNAEWRMHNAMFENTPEGMMDIREYDLDKDKAARNIVDYLLHISQ